MKCLLILFVIIFINFSYLSGTSDIPLKHPTIMIAILIRNKAHILPYFFSYLENLNYPKNRISIWIRSDHNDDDSIEIIDTWIQEAQNDYHNIDFEYLKEPKQYAREKSKVDWPQSRFEQIILLKDEALAVAKSIWADYIFFLDADVILTEANTLQHLISLNLPIVAPMLKSRSVYSNFWCGMSDNYYYKRTDEYNEIYKKRMIGSFSVPMVHSAVLINLKYSNCDFLTFNKDILIENQRKKLKTERIYDGPNDDIIIFAVSANNSGMQMYINNEKLYGFVPEPLDVSEAFENDIEQVVNIQISIINDINPEIRLTKEMQKFVSYPQKDKISLDNIYMINLDRRPDRKKTMEASFDVLGLDVERFPAVDGRDLSLDAINKIGIKLLPGYEDPYHHRMMTMGEVGCFLSHYNIWKDIINRNLKDALILEDDARFNPNFKIMSLEVLRQARSVGNWDLLFLGRKILSRKDESYVKNTNNLVKVGYSYWLVGYVLTLEGAKKLVDVKPLEKLIPVDELVPIMYDSHPNTTLLNEYSPRNLRAISSAPLLLFPKRYTGEPGHVSDTESSQLIKEIFNNNINVENKNGTLISHKLNLNKEEMVKKLVNDLNSKHDPSEL